MRVGQSSSSWYPSCITSRCRRDPEVLPGRGPDGRGPAVFSDVRTFNVSAKYGGGVVSRVQAASGLAARSSCGSPFEPGLLKAYAAHPVNTALILLSLGRLRLFRQPPEQVQDQQGRASSRCCPRLQATASPPYSINTRWRWGRWESVVAGYMFVQSLMSVPLMGAWLIWPREAGQAGRRDWRSEEDAAGSNPHRRELAWHHGLQERRHDLYARTRRTRRLSASPRRVFVSLFYLAVRHREEADPRAGFGVIACAVLLAALVAGALSFFLPPPDGEGEKKKMIK